MVGAETSAVGSGCGVHTDFDWDETRDLVFTAMFCVNVL